MNSLLVHGVYDLPTFQTLSKLGIVQFGFDLRGKSPNLIPFKDLGLLLPILSSSRTFLIFEDDKSTTILSFLNLLKNSPVKLILEMRDRQPAAFYQGLNHEFVWMYQPNSDWQEILNCDKLVGILLPVKWKVDYQKMSYLWEMIERRNLEVFIHTDNFIEAYTVPLNGEMKLSTDLSLEVEKSFRIVDQDFLKKLPLWSKYNENFARQ